MTKSAAEIARKIIYDYFSAPDKEVHRYVGLRESITQAILDAEERGMEKERTQWEGMACPHCGNYPETSGV